MQIVLKSALVFQIAGCLLLIFTLQCACAVVVKSIKAIRKLLFETIFDNEVAGVEAVFETDTGFRVAF